MIECPICKQGFDLEKTVIYQDERYCSKACAEIAAEEGKNTADQVEGEGEQTKAG